MTIGERIRRLRERKNISQEQLADAIGTTKQNIYKYEKGIVRNIPADKMEKIAFALGTSPGILMGWTAPNYGPRIRAVRLTLNLSQAELAKRAGISEQEIQQFENYEMPVEDVYVKKIAAGLGMTVGEFLFSEKFPLIIPLTETDMEAEATKDLNQSENIKTELSEIETRLIESFRQLTPLQQGEIIGRVSTLAERNTNSSQSNE